MACIRNCLTVLSLLALLPASFYCRHAIADLQTTNLAVLQGQTIFYFGELDESLGKLSELSCVPKRSANHLKIFQQASAETVSTFNHKYSSYVAKVTKPMSGNGKCDGGFNSVATESRNREKMSSELENQVFQIQSYYVENLHGHFSEVPIFLSDESEEQECHARGSELFDRARESGVYANEALANFRMATIMTERKFANFASKNSGLADNCGQTPGDLTSLLGEITYSNAKLPGGKFLVGPSRITGKLNEADLSNGSTQQIARPDFDDPKQENPSQISGSSKGGGAASDAPARSDGSAKQRRAMMQTLNEFGNKIVAADGGHKIYSEESEVSRLLAKGEAEKADQERVPSSTENGQGGSVLESALIARNAVENAPGGSQAAHELPSTSAAIAEQAGLAAAPDGADTSLFERIHSKLRGREL